MMQRPPLDSLPTTPGVYLYKDATGHIIYVGKARNVRKRVLSYFRPESQLTPKTVAMLRQAEQLDTLSTTTEKEALLLEASLIKKHRPRYNIVLRDDKQYVLFRLGRDHPYPRLEVVRQSRRDGARYFGPFTSGQAARETWKSLHRAFPLRRCTDRAMKNRVRPCLYFHLGQCLAPCTEEVSPIAYAELAHKVELLLAGRSRELLDKLTQAMQAASDALDFEHAAAMRDQIRAVERTVERQSVVLPEGSDLDIIGIVPAQGGLALGVLFVREGKLIDGRTFFWPALGLEEGPELLFSFLSQFYGPQAAIPPRIVMPWWPEPQGVHDGESAEDAEQPVENGAEHDADAEAVSVLADHTAEAAQADHTAEAAQAEHAAEAAQAEHAAEAAQAEHAAEAAQAEHAAEAAQAEQAAQTVIALESVLSGWREEPVRLSLARTPAERRLVDMAESNGREAARRQDASLAQRLGTALHLPGPVVRIECVDVSHTGGQSTRVGMVVFEDGKPRRSDYRTYIIETGGDDTAALAAWVTRRVESGPPWPDLALIDGGRGQVAAVIRALREAGQEQAFAVAGIAKARDEQGHADRRAGNVADRIILPNRLNALPLRPGSPELLFLQLVRDHAHRFALSRHRKARAKAALTGDLLRLPGVGPGTARLLWEHFANVQAMLDATPEDLARLPGIGKARAEALAARLQSLRGE